MTREGGRIPTTALRIRISIVYVTICYFFAILADTVRGWQGEQ
jgi:hypothetical protein